jgi:hypothetical protein
MKQSLEGPEIREKSDPVSTGYRETRRMTPDQIDTLAQMIANSLPGLVKEKTGPQSQYSRKISGAFTSKRTT